MAPRPRDTPPDPDKTQQMTAAQRDRLGYLLRTYGSDIPKNEFKRLMELRAGEKAGEFSLTKMWAERAIAKVESYIKPPRNIRPPMGSTGFDFWHLPQDVAEFKTRVAKAKAILQGQNVTGRKLAEQLAVASKGILEDIRTKRANNQPSVKKGTVDPVLERIWREGADARKQSKPARDAAAREKMQKQARIASGKSQRYTGGPSPSKVQTAALNRAYNASLKKLMTEFDKAGGAGTPDPATLPKGVVIASKGKAVPMDKAMRGIIERAIVAAGDGLTPEQRNKLLSVLVWNEAGVVNVDDQWASAAVDKLNNIVDQVDKTRVKPTTVKVGSKTVSTKTKSQQAYSPTRTPEEQAAIKQDIETRRNTRRNEAVKEAKGAIRDVFGSEPVVTRAPAAPAEPAAPQKVRITYRLDGKQGVATVELDKADAWVAGLKEDGAKGIKIEQIKTDAPVAGGAARQELRDAATREKLIVANEQKAAGSKTGGGGRRAGGKPPTRDAGFIDFGQMLRNRRTSGAAPALPKFSTPSGARIIRPSRPLMQTGGIRGISGVEGLMLGGMSGMAAQNSSSYVPGLTGKQFGGGSQQRAGKK